MSTSYRELYTLLAKIMQTINTNPNENEKEETLFASLSSVINTINARTVEIEEAIEKITLVRPSADFIAYKIVAGTDVPYDLTFGMRV